MELKTVMASLGESINNEELQEMIKEADLDGDGFINLQGNEKGKEKKKKRGLFLVCNQSFEIQKTKVLGGHVGGKQNHKQRKLMRFFC